MPAGRRTTSNCAGFRTDGVGTEYQIRLDGRAATSLVYGDVPRDRPSYSCSSCVGRGAGVRHRVRIGARLPGGTRGGYSVERTVTIGATGG